MKKKPYFPLPTPYSFTPFTNQPLTPKPISQEKKLP